MVADTVNYCGVDRLGLVPVFMSFFGFEMISTPLTIFNFANPHFQQPSASALFALRKRVDCKELIVGHSPFEDLFSPILPGLDF